MAKIPIHNITAAEIAVAATQSEGASGFTLEHKNKSVLLVTQVGPSDTSDAVTAIADGVRVGQLLTIIGVSLAGGLTILDGANTRLMGDWYASDRESWLKVAWDGSDWIEAGRGSGGLSAAGRQAHAEGEGTTASSTNSHAEGNRTTASGADSHAEGDNTTASGADSHAEGEDTVASGNRGHAEGKETTASGSFSHASGYRSSADLYAEYAHAAGYFATAGDAQYSRVEMRKATTDATLTEIFIDGVNDLLTILDEYTYACKVMVVGRQDTGEDNFMGTYHVLVRRTGGTVALVGAVDIIYENNVGSGAESPHLGQGGGLPVAITADDTNKSLKIAVEGLAGHNIRWLAVVDMIRVGYAD